MSPYMSPSPTVAILLHHISQNKPLNFVKPQKASNGCQSKHRSHERDGRAARRARLDAVAARVLGVLRGRLVHNIPRWSTPDYSSQPKLTLTAALPPDVQGAAAGRRDAAHLPTAARPLLLGAASQCHARHRPQAPLAGALQCSFSTKYQCTSAYRMCS